MRRGETRRNKHVYMMKAQARKDGVGKLVKVWTAGLAAASSCGGCKEKGILVAPKQLVGL
mgnify:CR=1 FL=1